MLERLLPAPSRPLIKLHILWRKDGVPLTGGLSDYNRRLTIPSPAGGDSGYYECEAVLRSSSVPAVVRGAYLSVLGEAGRGGAAAGLPRGAPLQGDPSRGCSYRCPWPFLPQSRLSSSRSQRDTSRPRWRKWWTSPVEPKVTRRAAWTKWGGVGKYPRTVRFSWPNHTGFSESHLLLHAPSSSRESAWLRADTPGNKQAKLP